MTVQHIADLEPARRTAILVAQIVEPGDPARGRDARHVREVHGFAVHQGPEPGRAAFPGHEARRRQGTAAVPPHHRGAQAGQGDRRGRRHRRRPRGRHEAARRRLCRSSSSVADVADQDILVTAAERYSRAAPVQPALPRGVPLPVEHAAGSCPGRHRTPQGDGPRRHPHVAQATAGIIPAAEMAQADLREAAQRTGGSTRPPCLPRCAID